MEDLGERLTGVTAIAVLGVALTALFLGFDWFWMVFVIGYAVVLPLVAILTGAGEEDEERSDAIADRIEGTVDDALGRVPDAETAGTGSKRDALELLRERYARGELSDEQFERKLDRLLETETLEGAREYAEGDPADEYAGSDRGGEFGGGEGNGERVPERE